MGSAANKVFNTPELIEYIIGYNLELLDQPNNLVITKRFYYGTKRINRNIIEENIYLRRKNYYRGQQIIKYQKYLNKYNNADDFFKLRETFKKHSNITLYILKCYIIVK